MTKRPFIILAGDRVADRWSPEGDICLQAQLDDYEWLETLPTFLARRWKRATDTLEPVRQREEAVACLELFLRVLCALTLAEYLAGARNDEDAERAITWVQDKPNDKISLGDWRTLSDALLKALSRRPVSDRFCGGVVDWYFDGRGTKLSAEAAIISDKLIPKRNKAQHGALEERFSAEEVNEIMSGLRAVLTSARWLSDYQFFSVVNKSRHPAYFQGVLRWYVGLVHRQSAKAIWSNSQLEASKSLMVATNGGRRILDLGHLLQADLTDTELRFDIFYELSSDQEVVLRDEKNAQSTAFDLEAIFTQMIDESKYPETFQVALRRRSVGATKEQAYEGRFCNYLTHGGGINSVEREFLAELVDGFDPVLLERKVILAEALRMLRNLDQDSYPALAALKDKSDGLDASHIEAALHDFGRAFEIHRDSRHKNYEAQLIEHLSKGGRIEAAESTSLQRMQEGFGLTAAQVRNIEKRVLKDLLIRRLRLKPESWAPALKFLNDADAPNGKQMAEAFEAFADAWGQKMEAERVTKLGKRARAEEKAEDTAEPTPIEAVPRQPDVESKPKTGRIIVALLVVGLSGVGAWVYTKAAADRAAAERVAAERVAAEMAAAEPAPEMAAAEPAPEMAAAQPAAADRAAADRASAEKVAAQKIASTDTEAPKQMEPAVKRVDLRIQGRKPDYFPGNRVKFVSRPVGANGKKVKTQVTYRSSPRALGRINQNGIFTFSKDRCGWVKIWAQAGTKRSKIIKLKCETLN